MVVVTGKSMWMFYQCAVKADWHAARAAVNHSVNSCVSTRHGCITESLGQIP